MPVVKSTEPMPVNEPIILIFADPGVGKTSVGHTCEDPILLDFDKGVNRSIGRKDVFVPSSWQEIVEEERGGLFKNYKTVVIDTPKAALDDFIVPYEIGNDHRMGLPKFKLQLFGSIGETFKHFVGRRRADTSAILLLCHAKKDDEGKMVPDITGQSYQLLMRIADQVGYMTIQNNQRKIIFEPSEHLATKNVAQLGPIIVPPKDSIEFATFGKYLVDTVRDAIGAMSEDQRAAMEESANYQKIINECTDISILNGLFDLISNLPKYLNIPLMQVLSEKYAEFINTSTEVDAFNDVFKEVNQQPDYIRKPLRIVVSTHAKVMKWTANATTGLFEAEPVVKSQLVQTNDDPADKTLFDKTDKKSTAKK